MTLPNFLCVGVIKGGTSTLHDILRQHPAIFLPERKELRFFDHADNFARGLGWYEEFFAGSGKATAIGEIAPTYAYPEFVPARIHNALGRNLRLIFLLRNPIDRAYSHYLMNRTKGTETHDFEEALKLETERRNVDQGREHRYSYLDQGYYSVQIRRYLEWFPKKSMRFIVFEDDLIGSRVETIRGLCQWLGVEDVPLDLDVWSNPGRPLSVPKVGVLAGVYEWPLARTLARTVPLRALKGAFVKTVPKNLERSVRARLFHEHFAEEVAVLERLIDRDLAKWRPTESRRTG